MAQSFSPFVRSELSCYLARSAYQNAPNLEERIAVLVGALALVMRIELRDPTSFEAIARHMESMISRAPEPNNALSKRITEVTQ